MTKTRSFKQLLKKVLPSFVLDFLYVVKYRRHRLPKAHIYQNIIKNMQGIEIGGPSIVFRLVLPVYPVISNLDGVNFSSTTMWEGAIDEGNPFRYYKNKTGKQFVAEATDLSGIRDNTYDFLLSSNCLEHIANPLKALDEWIRVVRPNGYFLLVLPKKESNFDHKRPITTFEHILEDYKNNMNEHDLTHLEEILELHDLSRDAPAGDFEQFKFRSSDNFSNRGLHHHVFDMALIKDIFKYYELDLIQSDETNTDYFALGRTK
jgi:SAM-dependent methyltransferase